MEKVKLETDGTVSGTTLMIDEKNVTKDEKVTSLHIRASSTYISKYSGETVPGSVYVSYEVMKDNGTTETKGLYTSNESGPKEGIGAKIDTVDSVKTLIGRSVDTQVSVMIDKIVDHCTKNNIPCQPRNVLESRTVDSLHDKLVDLGIG